MNEYTKLLEQVAAQADPTDLPSPVSIRQARDRRRRNTVALVAASVAVAAGAVIALGNVNTASHPQPIGPLPTQKPSASATAPPTQTLPDGDPVRIQKGLPYFDPSAVAHLHKAGDRGVYVVVGDTSGTFTGPRPTPPIWWSTDATTWHHATTGPDFPNVWDVASFNDEFVAVAPQGLHHSTAWLSTDGDHWTQLSVPADFHAFRVASIPAGLLAWDNHRAYISTTGQNWTALPALPDGASGHVCFVQPDAGKIVVGTNNKSLLKTSAWALTNQTWQRVRQPLPARYVDWCEQAYSAHSSVDGAAGTVTVHPFDSSGMDRVFVKRP